MNYYICYRIIIIIIIIVIIIINIIKKTIDTIISTIITSISMLTAIMGSIRKSLLYKQHIHDVSSLHQHNYQHISLNNLQKISNQIFNSQIKFIDAHLIINITNCCLYRKVGKLPIIINMYQFFFNNPKHYSYFSKNN